MTIKIGPGRDLRSVMQNVEQSRQAKKELERQSGASSETSERAVSGGKKAGVAMPLSYDFEMGPPDGGEKIYVAASKNAKKFGLENVNKKASRRADRSLESVTQKVNPTARGGGWQFIAPEDVGELASMEPPFALSSELDPSQDPFAMVEAAARTVSSELKMQPGLATMVQANVSPARAYELLSNR